MFNNLDLNIVIATGVQIFWIVFWFVLVTPSVYVCLHLKDLTRHRCTYFVTSELFECCVGDGSDCKFKFDVPIFRLETSCNLPSEMGKQCSLIHVVFFLSLSFINSLRVWYLADAKCLVMALGARCGFRMIYLDRRLVLAFYLSSASGVCNKFLESASKYHGSLVTYQLEIDHCY